MQLPMGLRQRLSGQPCRDAGPAPVEQLAELRRRLTPGSGRIAIASQPRCPGATADTTRKAGDDIENLLRRAGFERIRTETLKLDPPVVCVVAS